MLVKFDEVRAMRGLVVTTILAICLSSGVCFSQIYTVPPDSLGSRSNPLDKMQITSISGVVIGSDGTPVPDVRVEVRSEQTSRVVATSYTNNSGAFQFAGLPASGYDVMAMRGLSEAHEHVASGDFGMNLRLRLNTAAGATQADGNATVSVAQYKVPQKARDAYHKAEEALSKNHPDDVTKDLAKALDIYPDYAEALTLRGVMSLDASHPEAALNDFDHAIRSDPGYSLAYTAMSAALNQLHKFDDALRSADRAITLSPSSWQSYFEMAKAYVGKADYQHALQQLSKAQSFLPKEYAPLHLVRAHVMLALKNYPEGLAELQEFLTLAPQDPNAAAARDAVGKLKAYMAAANRAVPAVH
jgi:tetratricopeptide (TPR) repeat protein